LLADAIQDAAELSVLSSGFSTYAYHGLRKAFGRLAAARLLLPGAANPEDPFQLEGLTDAGADRPLRNGLDGAAIARDCADWLERTAKIRAMMKPAGHNLFHIGNADAQVLAIHGSTRIKALEGQRQA